MVAPQIFFLFTPKIGEDESISILTNDFLDGLKPPTSNPINTYKITGEIPEDDPPILFQKIDGQILRGAASGNTQKRQGTRREAEGFQ